MLLAPEHDETWQKIVHMLEKELPHGITRVRSCRKFLRLAGITVHADMALFLFKRKLF